MTSTDAMSQHQHKDDLDFYDWLNVEKHELQQSLTNLHAHRQNTIDKVKALLRKHLTTYVLIQCEPDMFVQNKATKLAVRQHVDASPMPSPSPLPPSVELPGMNRVNSAIEQHITTLLGMLRQHFNITYTVPSGGDNEFWHSCKSILGQINDEQPGMKCVEAARREIGRSEEGSSN